jgi:lysophospholipase L1-like esterase
MRTALATISLILTCLACAPSSSRQTVVVQTEKWDPHILKFEEADLASPPPADAVLFVGSSSVRGWKSLAEDFPDIAVINRGFGGSRIADCTHYIDRIVVPYRPRLVVLYAGDNDVAGGHTPEQVLEDYKEFVRQVRRGLPRVPIAFIAIKPSPARIQHLETMREANRLVRAYADRKSYLAYIDVFNPMLGPDGTPRPELYAKDRLHLSREGYDLWTAVVGPYLDSDTWVKKGFWSSGQSLQDVLLASGM